MSNAAIKLAPKIPVLPVSAHAPSICWRKISDEKGRGVFAMRFIKKGEVVEHAPAIPLPVSDIIPDSVPDSYVLMWNEGQKDECYCLVGGFVMLYNHNKEKANISMAEDKENMAVTVTALRDIEVGEELLWNYDCEIWFDVK